MCFFSFGIDRTQDTFYLKSNFDVCGGTFHFKSSMSFDMMALLRQQISDTSKVSSSNSIRTKPAVAKYVCGCVDLFCVPLVCIFETGHCVSIFFSILFYFRNLPPKAECNNLSMYISRKPSRLSTRAPESRPKMIGEIVSVSELCVDRHKYLCLLTVYCTVKFQQ